MKIIKSIRRMQHLSDQLRRDNKSIGFVPTMGALHEGHLSLIRRASKEDGMVVVSIFVNPLQFGPSEDFNKYPRDTRGDSEKLKKEGIGILFMPEASDMYPEGFSTRVEVEGISNKLCGKFRPGHFRGVATVVTKLFNIVKPHRAYFGQKDFEQAVIIKRSVKDLNMDIDIIVCPIVREKDGLAMSSRNLYLNPEERKAATVIYGCLMETTNLIKSGIIDKARINRFMKERLSREPLVTEIQYASAYDPETLDELPEVKQEVLLAVALKIGKTRLIDNVLLKI